MSTINKILVGATEAGELSSVSAQLVRDWCAHNVIPHMRNGNRFLVRVDTLDLFLELNEGKDLSQFDTLINPEIEVKKVRKEGKSCVDIKEKVQSHRKENC